MTKQSQVSTSPTANLLAQLRAAYESSSPGEWKSKSCLFKAHDRDFATMAHNAMPLLLEVVERFQEVHAGLAESDPAYMLSSTGLTNAQLIAELEGKGGQHPLVPVFFRTDASPAGIQAQLSLTTGEIFVAEEWRGLSMQEWIEPLTKGTGANATPDADSKYRIDTKDLNEFRSIYGRDDLLELKASDPEIVYHDASYIDCVIYVPMPCKGGEWKVTYSKDLHAGTYFRINEYSPNAESGFDETAMPVPCAVDAAFAAIRDAVIELIDAEAAKRGATATAS